MIAIVGTDNSILSSVRVTIEDLDTLLFLDNLDDVATVEMHVRAIVVCVEQLRSTVADKVVNLSSRWPLIPAFLVSSLDPVAVDVAYTLHTRMILVWLDELPSLRSKVLAQMHKSPLEGFYEALVRRSVSPLMQDALRIICLSGIVVPHLKGLSARLHVSPMTLRRHWRKEISAQISPKQLLDWRILLEWVQRAPTMSLDEAAALLRVDPRTLERITRRCVRLTPTRAAHERGVVQRLFAEWATRVLSITA